jgi:hypothetical protein
MLLMICKLLNSLCHLKVFFKIIYLHSHCIGLRRRKLSRIPSMIGVSKKRGGEAPLYPQDGSAAGAAEGELFGLSHRPRQPLFGHLDPALVSSALIWQQQQSVSSTPPSQGPEAGGGKRDEDARIMM